MIRSLVLLLFTALLFMPATSRAQIVREQVVPLTSGEAAPTPAQAKVDAATEKKALDLIESLSEQVGNLRSNSNRMQAQVTVGDLLWTRDEKRARALFAAALSQLVARISEIDFGDPEVYQELTKINAMRQQLIMRLARRDAELGVTALRQTRLQPDSAGKPRGNFEIQAESALEMNVANIIVSKDPAAALKLARNSLARGVSWNVINFLPQLYQKDHDAGQELYRDLVTGLKNENFARNPEAANNAWNLLNVFQPPQANEDLYRDLLSTAVGHVLSGSRQTQRGLSIAENVYHQLDRISPLVEKYVPARAAELREWAQAVERTLDPQTRMYQEVQKISQNGTVDEIMAVASNYPPDLRTVLYQSAAWKALNSNDRARAREIAEMIPDPIQRRQVMDQVDNLNDTATEGGNAMVEARRLVGKSRNLYQKIEITLRAAEKLVGQGDKKGALDLLSEARVLLAAAPQSINQISGQLRVAVAFQKLDPEQAFTMLQPLVTKVNELVAAAAVLDGIDFQYLKDGEWVMPGMNNLGAVVGQLDHALASLGQIDFDRARTLADQLERPEIRLLLEIDLAQTALGVAPVNLPNFSSRGFSRFH
jgi:hypothetical protein